MRTILSFLVILSISISSYAQAQKPHFKFEKETHDFGTFKEEKGVQIYQFKFKNTGKLPLVITNIKGSCGCTTPEWSKAPVASGKEGFIKVSFDPNDRPGPFNKSITVTSNSDEPNKVLYIKGKVIAKVRTVADNYPHQMGALRLKNAHIAMTRIANNTEKSGEIIFFNPSEKPIKVTFDAVPKHIKISQKKIVIPPKKVVNTEIVYDARLKKDWGFVTDMIYVIVDGKRDSKNRLKVSADIFEDFSGMSAEAKQKAPTIKISKRLIDLGNVKEGDVIKQEVQISNTGKSDLIIRKIDRSCGCTVAKLGTTVIKPGASELLKLTFDSQGLSGKQMKTVTIISNDPKKSKAVIRIKGVVAK